MAGKMGHLPRGVPPKFFMFIGFFFPKNMEAFQDLHFLSVAMPADSRREKIFDFVREFAVKDFRIVPVRDFTQQNKA